MVSTFLGFLTFSITIPYLAKISSFSLISLFIFFISKEQISKNSSSFILNPLFLKLCPLAFIFIGIISLITHKISFSHTPLLFIAYLSFNKLRLLNSILYSF